MDKCQFVAAMASSINYSAPAHVDHDFMFSIHQINVDGGWNAKLNNPIVQWFCFPTEECCVGLCPGDVDNFLCVLREYIRY